MDTNSLTLATYLFPHLHDELVIFFRHGAHQHLLGEAVAILQPHSQSVFGVDSHHQRYLGLFLQTLGQLDLLGCSSGKEADTSNLVFLYLLEELVFPLGTHIDRHPYHHQLADHLLQRHLGHHRVGPSFTLVVALAQLYLGLRDLLGLLVFLSHCRRSRQQCYHQKYYNFPYHTMLTYECQ